MRIVKLSLFAVATGCAAAPVDMMPVGDGGFVPAPDVPTAPECRGNRDGVIARSEVNFAPGVQVRYRVNPVGTLALVSPDGTRNPDGTRVWDFTDRSGDTVTLTLLTATGQWFAGRFQGAQYAARLDPRSPNLGVYRATEGSVDLMGVAGAAESDGTLVPYDNPIAVLRFPLHTAMTWTAQATTVNATFDHNPVASADRYEVTVDGRGAVRLPELTFLDALRIRVEVVQRFPAGPMRRRIQYLWMVECYGEVARMTSRDDEIDPSFTMASEFRRLGL